MTISLALLSRPHQEAAHTIVEELLKPGVDINNLVIGQSAIHDDGDGVLTVNVDSEAYNDPTWTYRGSVDLRYKRVDLNVAFGALKLRCYVGAEYTTQKVVDRLKQVFGLHFEPNEFVNETIPMTTLGRRVLLRAAADSLRWKGQVSVFVYR